MNIRIVIAENDVSTRNRLRLLAKNHPDMEVIGEAEDEKTAMEMVRKLAPDLVIMNVDMPARKGIDSIKYIIKTLHIKVIAFLLHPDKQTIKKVFKAGASGYLLKNCRSNDFEHAVHDVIKNDFSLSPEKIDNYIDLIYGVTTNE